MNEDQQSEVRQTQRPYRKRNVDEAAQRVDDTADGENTDISEDGSENGVFGGHAGFLTTKPPGCPCRKPYLRLWPDSLTVRG